MREGGGCRMRDEYPILNGRDGSRCVAVSGYEKDYQFTKNQKNQE
jgi:hypothetical protein